MTTVCGIATALVIATGVSLAFAFQANDARQRAEAEEKKAIAAQRQSERSFGAALTAIDKLLAHASTPELKELPQSQLVRKRMLEDVLTLYNGSAEEIKASDEMRHRVASTQLEFAEATTALGNYEQANQAYEAALATISELIQKHPEHYEYRNTKIGILHDKGYFHLWKEYDYEKARLCFADSLAEVQVIQRGRKLGLFPQANDQVLRIKEVNETMGLAHVASYTSDRKERERRIREAYRLVHESGFDYRPSRAFMTGNIASLEANTDPDAAEAHFQEAIEEWEAISAEVPIRQNYRYLMSTLNEAALFFRTRNPELAAQYAWQAVDVVEQQALLFPSQQEYWIQLWDYLATVVSILEQSYSEVELREALDKYDAYLVHSPKHHELFQYRIWVQFRIGNYERALTDIRNMLEINAQWISKLQQSLLPEMIAACSSIDFQTRILELMQELVNRYPDSTSIRGYRARLWLAMERYLESLDDLKILIERKGLDSDVGYSFAVASLSRGDVKTYRQVCEHTVDSSGSSVDPRGLFLAAWVCSLAPGALDDMNLAIACAERAVAMTSEEAMYLGGLGAILFRSGRYQEAAEQLAGALQLTSAVQPTSALQLTAGPNKFSAFHHYFLAMTQQALGNSDAANEMLTKANELASTELLSSPSRNQTLTLKLLRSEVDEMLSN